MERVVVVRQLVERQQLVWLLVVGELLERLLVVRQQLVRQLVVGELLERLLVVRQQLVRQLVERVVLVDRRLGVGRA
jgi:hypothetical protein